MCFGGENVVLHVLSLFSFGVYALDGMFVTKNKLMLFNFCNTFSILGIGLLQLLRKASHIMQSFWRAHARVRRGHVG